MWHYQNPVGSEIAHCLKLFRICIEYYFHSFTTKAYTYIVFIDKEFDISGWIWYLISTLYSIVGDALTFISETLQKCFTSITAFTVSSVSFQDLKHATDGLLYQICTIISRGVESLMAQDSYLADWIVSLGMYGCQIWYIGSILACIVAILWIIYKIIRILNFKTILRVVMILVMTILLFCAICDVLKLMIHNEDNIEIAYHRCMLTYYKYYSALPTLVYSDENRYFSSNHVSERCTIRGYTGYYDDYCGEEWSIQSEEYYYNYYYRANVEMRWKWLSIEQSVVYQMLYKPAKQGIIAKYESIRNVSNSNSTLNIARSTSMAIKNTTNEAFSLIQSVKQVINRVLSDANASCMIRRSSRSNNIGYGESSKIQAQQADLKFTSKPDVLIIDNHDHDRPIQQDEIPTIVPTSMPTNSLRAKYDHKTKRIAKADASMASMYMAQLLDYESPNNSDLSGLIAETSEQHRRSIYNNEDDELFNSKVSFRTGGSGDISVFREKIKHGLLPDKDDITFEGIFNEYYFDVSSNTHGINPSFKNCVKNGYLFCPSYSQAIAASVDHMY